MLDYDELFAAPLFGLAKDDKDRLHKRWVEELSAFHAERCPEYRRLYEALGSGCAVPVRLFKEFEMRSAEVDTILKTMTSSGTTGQAKSMIYLDRDTSSRQSKALARIVADFTGTKSRLPLLVIDAPGTVKNRSMFSARTAGIRGFSMLGRDVTFALHDDMSLDRDSIADFCEKHENEDVMLFGFTFMIWKYFIRELEKSNENLNLRGLLIHGGGWKKLENEAVSHDEFNSRVLSACGGVRACDYYGMVEQTGSIAMECPEGHLHASVFSDIAILDPYTFAPQSIGERGLIQSTSLLPTSYPGHVLLTEDEGTIIGIDDCPCGRMGVYFEVHGRLPGAEIRGCSDTYERR